MVIIYIQHVKLVARLVNVRPTGCEFDMLDLHGQKTLKPWKIFKSIMFFYTPITNEENSHVYNSIKKNKIPANKLNQRGKELDSGN